LSRTPGWRAVRTFPGRHIRTAFQFTIAAAEGTASGQKSTLQVAIKQSSALLDPV
jgi:hypothetical protein